MTMSGVARTGLIEVLRALRAQIDADRLRMREGREEPAPWQP
jgi:GTP-binding protein